MKKNLVKKIELIKAYDPVWSIPEKINKFFKVIMFFDFKEFMEKEKLEELTEYSLSLRTFVSYIIEILKVRKTVIIRLFRYKKILKN